METQTINGDDVRRAFKKLSDEYAGVAQEISRVPGLAIAVVYLGDAPYTATHCAGVRSIVTGGDVDADTLFQLASLSKPISSTVVAAQVAREQVAWAAPVARLDPRFPLGNPGVTLESLLAHRSGLPEHAGDLLEDTGYARDEVLTRLKRLPLVPPDAKAARYSAGYAYTNFGFTLGACAAARTAGGTWEQLAMTQLQKLGMRATCVTHQQLMKVQNRAVLHRRDPTPLDGADPFPAVRRWILSARDPDAQAPAGGVASSVTDLTAWMRVHLDAHVSPDDPFRAALRYTHTPYLPGASYGLGWNCGTSNGVAHIGHSGAFTLGAATAASLVPSARLGVVVLTNSQPLGVPEALCTAFLMELGLTKGKPVVFPEVLRGFGGKMQHYLYPLPEFDYSHPPKSPRPPRAAVAYTGKYAHDFYGPVTVYQERDTLGVTLGSIECALDHWDGDTFTYLPPGENGGLRGGITFGASAERIVDLRDTHLFEPYPLGEAPPDDTADTWHGVFTVDTRLRVPARGVIRKFSFVAKHSQPLRLLIYRQRDAQSPYVMCGATKLVTPTEGDNEFYADNLEVEAGDFVGFHQPEVGALAFHLDDPAYDRGRGNLTGPVLFTAARASDSTAFEYSSARRYHLSVEFAWGLRGAGHATRI
jgi:CubicO group peptidase (beta-lactamase class C family)